MSVKISFQSLVTRKDFKRNFRLDLDGWHKRAFLSGRHEYHRKGFVIGSIFYIRYRESLMKSITLSQRPRLRLSPHSSALGRIKVKDGKAYISYRLYNHGLTNLFELFLWVAIPIILSVLRLGTHFLLHNYIPIPELWRIVLPIPAFFAFSYIVFLIFSIIEMNNSLLLSNEQAIEDYILYCSKPRG